MEKIKIIKNIFYCVFVTFLLVSCKTNSNKTIEANSEKESSNVHSNDGFIIGLSMYSVRDLFKDGTLELLDFPAFAKDSFGITEIDIWDGGLPKNRINDPEMYKELKKRADKVGSNIFSLMGGVIDAEASSAEEIKTETENFFPKVDNAVLLGAKYLRVFLKAPDTDKKNAIDKSIKVLLPLVKYAKKKGVIIVIEPGSSELSSNGVFLAEVMKEMNNPSCRLIPDFGKMLNHDPYKGTIAMMPYTEVISAKTHDFLPDGSQKDFDYPRLLKSVLEADFHGIVAIEYEGSNLNQIEGVRASKKLLENSIKSWKKETLPQWAIGPFKRPINAEPVIKPNPENSFFCPMRKKEVAWEGRHTFNPAAVVKDGKIYVLYRAEDNSSKGGIGTFTSRLGLAVSDDGVNFKTESKPVFFPDEDAQKDFEWYGGCEDPRVTESPDGTYILTYTRYARDAVGPLRPRLGIATSKDLRNWTKHGSPLTNPEYADMESKSASIVNVIKDGRLVAVKINGKYWMYYGVKKVFMATSDNLIHWTTIEEYKGKRLAVLDPRSGYFDSRLNEVGPQVLLTDDGIVLMYNGMNQDKENADKADPSLPFRIYTCGQALFDPKDPTKLLSRLEEPFMKPELDWEKSGQYVDGTTFIEGIVLYKDKWFLYYGCADTYVGVTIADAKMTQAK